MLKLKSEGVLIDDCYTGEKQVRIYCMLLCAVADYRGLPELTHQMGHPALIGACLLCWIRGRRLRDNRTTVYPHVCRCLPLESSQAERQAWHYAMQPDVRLSDEVTGVEHDIITLPPFALKTEEEIEENVQDVINNIMQPNEVGFHAPHVFHRSKHIRITTHYINCCMHMLKNAAEAIFGYTCAYVNLKWKFRKSAYRHSRFADTLDAVTY
jgi:hypothetical protein